MATHDYVIDNQSSATARADINNVLQAILTNNSGSSAPSTTAANMLWYDTSNNELKIRDEADSGWIVIAYLDQANDRMEVRSDVIQAASAGGIDVKNSSGTTIIDLQVASQATAEAGTNNTELMTPLRTKQAITENVQTLNLDDVGTYVFAFGGDTSNPSSRDYVATAPGDTLAGSKLIPIGINSNTYNGGNANTGTDHNIGGMSLHADNIQFLSGTWRCMGDGRLNTSTNGVASLWVRIS